MNNKVSLNDAGTKTSSGIYYIPKLEYHYSNTTKFVPKSYDQQFIDKMIADNFYRKLKLIYRVL